MTGPIKLVLWVSSTQKDMDIFATIRNIGRDGKDVWEVGQQGQPMPVAKGWLRASHRKLDPKRSLPYRPYHAHDERWWLKPGEPVECEIEIWPAVHGVQAKATASGSTSSRATASVQRAVPALSGRLQYRRREHRAYRREDGVVPDVADYSAEKP